MESLKKSKQEIVICQKIGACLKIGELFKRFLYIEEKSYCCNISGLLKKSTAL